MRLKYSKYVCRSNRCNVPVLRKLCIPFLCRRSQLWWNIELFLQLINTRNGCKELCCKESADNCLASLALEHEGLEAVINSFCVSHQCGDKLDIWDSERVYCACEGSRVVRVRAVMETRVAVPLRAGGGGKKMRKRKELDALGRRCRRGGGGISSQVRRLWHRTVHKSREVCQGRSTVNTGQL